VLVEGDKKIYDTHNEQLRLWGYSLLISWFIFGLRSKFFENVQIFTSFFVSAITHFVNISIAKTHT
jgi:hypothetical protein